MDLVETERTKYADVWSALPMYGDHAPGEVWAKAFLQMSGTRMGGSVLDAGCGSGKGALELKACGFGRVALCDLTDEGLVEAARDLPFHQMCLWDNLKARLGFFDWVYCTDVMEHLPTEFVMLTVSRLLEVARRGVFFSICLQADNLGQLMGTPLHQTVKPFTWWRDRLHTLGAVKECRDCLETGLYLVVPR